MITIERTQLNTAEMQTLINDGHRVRETPHLGGPHYGKYALTLGGLASHVVMVDTTKAARDKFGKAQDVAGVRFVSNKIGEQKPAAALHGIKLASDAQEKFDKVLTELGVSNTEDFCSNGVADLVKLHVHCVKSTTDTDVSVKTFAELWRGSGDTGLAMMQYLADHNMLSRWYDSESGKIRDVGISNQSTLLNSEGRYFDNGDRVHGVLPNVESMLAIEAVAAGLQGRDVTYDHLYVMSTEYTKDAVTVERIRSIAEGTLALLGVSDVSVRYNFVIADNASLDKMGGKKDHFSMMRDGQRFDAQLLINAAAEHSYV